MVKPKQNMKLRNKKITGMTGLSTACGLGSPLGRVLEMETPLKDDGCSTGAFYTNHPPKTPRYIKKIIDSPLNLKDLFPNDLDIPNLNSKVSISEFGNFVSPPRTPKHKKYNLKNF